MSSPDSNRRNQGGWTIGEVLFATAAAVAIAAVGAYAFSGAAERSQARVKAAWVAQAITSSQAQWGNRVIITRTFTDGRRFLEACGVDAGDTAIPGAGVTVHCVDPLVEPTATILPATPPPPLPPTLPERCSGTLTQRLSSLAAGYGPGLTPPTTTEVYQGIWAPADNDADARAIAHLVQRGIDSMDPNTFPFPRRITVSPAGVLVCL